MLLSNFQWPYNLCLMVDGLPGIYPKAIENEWANVINFLCKIKEKIGKTHIQRIINFVFGGLK